MVGSILESSLVLRGGWKTDGDVQIMFRIGFPQARTEEIGFRNAFLQKVLSRSVYVDLWDSLILSRLISSVQMSS